MDFMLVILEALHLHLKLAFTEWTTQTSILVKKMTMTFRTLPWSSMRIQLEEIEWDVVSSQSGPFEHFSE